MNNILHVVADIVVAIWHLRRQKFAGLKVVLSFFEFFFFGFSMVKIHFLQKVLKKWSSFRKKNKKHFP